MLSQISQDRQKNPHATIPCLPIGLGKMNFRWLGEMTGNINVGCEKVNSMANSAFSFWKQALVMPCVYPNSRFK